MISSKGPDGVRGLSAGRRPDETYYYSRSIYIVENLGTFSHAKHTCIYSFRLIVSSTQAAFALYPLLLGEFFEAPQLDFNALSDLRLHNMSEYLQTLVPIRTGP